MEKIVADESTKMVGAIQTYLNEDFQDWLMIQSDEYLAQKTAFEAWQEFQKTVK